jgi:hypothetical protein
MSYLRFNRHQIFDRDMMDFHSKTLNMVEEFHMNRNESWFNEVYNMLCGVWDGYLYTDLLESSKQLGYPTPILNRIEYTINFIQK